jgi:pimeloyl-ACP methyl ester carboxylesterase
LAAAAAIEWQTTRRQVHGLELEILSGGQGEPLLILHDQEYLNTTYPYLDALAERYAVMVPSHPGFGQSQIRPDMDCMDDMVYVYLDLLRDLGQARLIGCGLGGWMAAEIAVHCTEHVLRLALVDAVGIKVGGYTDRDIADNFLMDTRAFLEATWHDPAAAADLMKLPGPDLPEEDIVALMQNRQTTALIAWKPFMHNPKLRQRLYRVNVPTLVVWGASDKIVTPAYGKAYADAIPGAKFIEIPNAGHYPYLEQPEAFARAALEFLS